MATLAARNINISLPQNVAASTSSSDIISLLLDRAMTKAEFFKSKSRLYQHRHGMQFVEFKKLGDESEESFAAWDDLLLWEGYELAYREWLSRYEELLKCMK
jgi:hypothetical protein